MMQILSSFKVAYHLGFIFLILCVTKTEQRASSRVANGHQLINSGNENTHDETQGFDLIKSFPFFRTAIPNGIYDCISAHGIMRCMKIYVLQKMEEHKFQHRTGNLTRDFLEQFAEEKDGEGNLKTALYDQLDDNELSKRLIFNFQQFFKSRDIKLHFLPGIMVRIVPSKDNKLKFSFKKKIKADHQSTGRARKTGDNDAEENLSIEETASTAVSNPPIGELKGPLNLIKKRRKNKKDGNSYKNAIIQMAVPVMVMPAVLLGSILPFLLPVLKMATIMTLVMNHSAFIAALIYAARTHANAQEEQHISYGTHPAFH